MQVDVNSKAKAAVDPERPDVTVVIVSYNTVQLLDRMFTALEAGRGSLRLQTIVVDNASRDGSVTHLQAKYPDIEIVANEANVGFGRANNQALPIARGRYVLLLNTDAFMSPNALQDTVEYMDRQRDCGILGVKLIGEDGSLQPSCRYFPTPWNIFLVTTGLAPFFPRAETHRRHGLGSQHDPRLRLGARLLLSGSSRCHRAGRPF